MDELKRIEEDTTNVLFDYMSVESASDRSSGKRSDSQSRTASVQKAKALLRNACSGKSSNDSEHRAKVEAATISDSVYEQKVTITESEGFVIVSTPEEVPAPCSPATQTPITSHLPKVDCGTTSKRSASSLKRPGSLSLQAAKDPGDPPLFSPNSSDFAHSYPPPSTGVVRMASYMSSPVLNCAGTHPRSCVNENRASDQITKGRHCCALPSHPTKLLDNEVCEVSTRVRSRLIAERLKMIGDSIDRDHRRNNSKDQLSNLMSNLLGMTSGWSALSWREVTMVFMNLYRLSTQLNSEFGDNPPHSDDMWQLFQKTFNFLRDKIVPWISTNGGWGAFLRSTTDCGHGLSHQPESYPLIGSPLVSRHRHLSGVNSTPVPTLPQCEVRTARILHMVSPRTSTSPYSKLFQASPGSQRNLKICRSKTLPIDTSNKPPKLWRLSESGSLVDEEGNEDFEKGFSPRSDNASVLESSQLSDSDQERDEMVFSVDEELHANPTTPRADLIKLADVPCVYQVTSTPVIVSHGHDEENEDQEFLCDSGLVSSQETLSLSSTPPQEVVFAVGSTSLSPHSPFSDSAVDVSSPSNVTQRQRGKDRKYRPNSGYSSKEDITPFDRERSRSMPMSRRSKSGGNEKRQGSNGSFHERRGREAQPIVVSSSPPCETSYSSGSISLSPSAAVLYEAVCSLLRN